MRYLVLFLSTVLISCSSENYYSEYQPTSKEYTWDKKDTKSFNFTIDQKDNFNIKLNVKYLTGFRWDTLKLHWDIKGNIDFQPEFLDANIPIIDSKGKHIGDVNFDIWHTTASLVDNILLKKGEYRLSVTHNMPEDILPYVTEIGITIEKL